ncbi:MAG: hypothetical protein ACOYT4_05000 [Nanoarchaeota archaeon]
MIKGNNHSAIDENSPFFYSILLEYKKMKESGHWVSSFFPDYNPREHKTRTNAWICTLISHLDIVKKNKIKLIDSPQDINLIKYKLDTNYHVDIGIIVGENYSGDLIRGIPDKRKANLLIPFSALDLEKDFDNAFQYTESQSSIYGAYFFYNGDSCDNHLLESGLEKQISLKGDKVYLLYYEKSYSKNGFCIEQDFSKSRENGKIIFKQDSCYYSQVPVRPHKFEQMNLFP